MSEKEAQTFQGLKIPSWALALMWGVAATVVSLTTAAVAWAFTFNTAMRDRMGSIESAVQSSAALSELQMKTINNTMTRLEKRVDVDNQTRYTAGEARRDFAVVDRKLDDHEVRIRALEKKDRP